MPSQTKENYLKAIYFLQERNTEVSTTAIGEAMQVSKPTVNSMIKKMANLGWINYEKYKPIRLTKLGRRTAALIIRKHRLTEMFLVQVMGFGWEEVHQIAEEMEHLKSEQLFDRMDEILAFPSTDPHGSPIPNREGVTFQKQYLPLSQYSVGSCVRLKAIGDSSAELLLLLNEKSIQLDTLFEVKKIEAFDKTMTVDYEENKGVMLSNEVCRRLLVE